MCKCKLTNTCLQTGGHLPARSCLNISKIQNDMKGRAITEIFFNNLKLASIQMSRIEL